MNGTTDIDTKMNDRTKLKVQTEAAPLIRPDAGHAGNRRKSGAEAGCFKIAAAAFAVAFVMTGCGTTPSPEPEGERIWVNFPVFEKTSKTVNAPITDPNASGNRVVVNQVKTEAVLPKELADLRAAEAAKAGQPDLRMRPEQPVPTPPVPAGSKPETGGQGVTVKPSEADKTTAVSNQKPYIVAVPAATVAPAIVIDQQGKKTEAEERRQRGNVEEKTTEAHGGQEKAKPKTETHSTNAVEVKADIRASIDIDTKASAEPDVTGSPGQIEKAASKPASGMALTSVDRIRHESVNSGADSTPTTDKSSDPGKTAPSAPDKEAENNEKSEKPIGPASEEFAEPALSTLSKTDSELADPQAARSDSDMKAEATSNSNEKADATTDDAPETPAPQSNESKALIVHNSAGVGSKAENVAVGVAEEPAESTGVSPETHNPVQIESTDPSVTAPSESDREAATHTEAEGTAATPAATPTEGSAGPLKGAQMPEILANP